MLCALKRHNFYAMCFHICWGLIFHHRAKTKKQIICVEVYVQIKVFDDVYFIIVIQRHSYTHEEIIFNVKLVTMYWKVNMLKRHSWN